jgi:phosphoglycerate dehydrogenase-like enzyme
MKVVCIFPPDPNRDASGIVPEGWDMTIIESVDELTDELVDGLDVLITTTFFHLDRETLERLKGVKLIQQLGVGVDSIDIEAAKEFGIPVANVSRANSVSVAEYVVMAIMYVIRRVPEAVEIARKAELATGVLATKGSYEIRGKKLGIVGFGAIGYEVAMRAKALGMELLSYDVIEPAPAEKELGVRRVDFDTLLAASDVVTLHVPLNEETHHLIDAAALGKMKQSACLINAARGGVVDEAALAEALRSGHLMGAAVDVTEVEPTPADNPLWDAPNVLLTPHIAGSTTDAVNYMVQKSFQNCYRIFMGEEPEDRVC